MSELIQQNDNRATIRWKLLTGASALALTAYVSSASIAKAEDTDHPLLWVELGGQMEMAQGLSSPFKAPFMYITPTPGPYKDGSPVDSQRPPRIGFDIDSKITFQPEDSDWLFSAAVRYGRLHAKRHVHHQTSIFYTYTPGNPPHEKYVAQFADINMPFQEKHAILDFQAGRDVGLGKFGSLGKSTISGGIRFAQTKSKLSLDIRARPVVDLFYNALAYFHEYTLLAQAERSFKGIGPSLSWNASAALAGEPEAGEITLDWGVTVAALFGRQKAKTQHSTQAYYLTHYIKYYPQVYHHAPPPSTRSRSVVVPNLSGFVGVSARFKDAKVSIGYRGDIFFKAMDTGIDATKKSDLTFNGPYASISIGLGG